MLHSHSSTIKCEKMNKTFIPGLYTYAGFKIPLQNTPLSLFLLQTNVDF